MNGRGERHVCLGRVPLCVLAAWCVLSCVIPRAWGEDPPMAVAVADGESAEEAVRAARVAYERAEYVRARAQAEKALARGATGNDRETAQDIVRYASDQIRSRRIFFFPENVNVQVDGMPLEEASAPPDSAPDAPKRFLAGTREKGPGEALSGPMSVLTPICGGAGQENQQPAPGQLRGRWAVIDVDSLDTSVAAEQQKKTQVVVSCDGCKRREIEYRANVQWKSKGQIVACPNDEILDTYRHFPARKEEIEKKYPFVKAYMESPTYRAQCLFDDAMDAKQKKETERARELLEEANAACQNGVFRYGLANAQYENGEYLLARRSFAEARRLLRREGDTRLDADLSTTMAQIDREIQEHLTRITLHVSPQDARIRVDNGPLVAEQEAAGGIGGAWLGGTGIRGPGNVIGSPSIVVWVTHGMHRFSFEREGFSPHDVEQLVGGPAMELHVKLEGKRQTRAFGLAVGGVGLAAAGVGGAFGVAAVFEGQASKAQCRGAICTAPGREALGRAHQFADLSSWFIGGGLLACGAASLLLFVPGQTSTHEVRGSHARGVGLSLSLGFNGASMFVEGTW